MTDDIQETTDITSSDEQYVSAERAEDLGRHVITRRGDSADEIDSRKLFRNPTLSELRWYYRRTFAKIIIDKPVDDAFKNGFELTGQDAEWAEELIDNVDYRKNYMDAQKKARRDGFCTMFIGTLDNTAGVHTSLQDARVVKITHTKVFSVDDLSYCAEAEIQDTVKEEFGLEVGQFECRRTGIVINKDPTSKDFRDPIGYVVSQNSKPVFIHKDRMLHFTWNDTVDGDYYDDPERLGVNRWGDSRALGKWEGDSELIRSYDLFKGLAKGNWAVMQALFRNASNMYAVHLPISADEDDWEQANMAFRSMNAKSEFIVPRGEHERDEYKIEQFESGDMMEPREHYDVIFDQICACHEMTKSVLFGTQTGVVSGSETDIKNYFNQVERTRQNRFTNDMKAFLARAKWMKDGRRTQQDVNVEVEWGPLFKVGEEEQFGMFLNMANALTIMINGYMMTPDEARDVLSEKWSEWDIDLGKMTEKDRDMLDRINLVQVGAYEGANLAEAENGNESGGNGTTTQRRSGGMSQGQQTSSLANSDEGIGITDDTDEGANAVDNITDVDTPSESSQDSQVGDEVIDAIADRVLQRIEEKMGGDSSLTEEGK